MNYFIKLPAEDHKEAIGDNYDGDKPSSVGPNDVYAYALCDDAEGKNFVNVGTHKVDAEDEGYDSDCPPNTKYCFFAHDCQSFHFFFLKSSKVLVY